METDSVSPKASFQNRLPEIYYAGRPSLEDQGVNIFYITLGLADKFKLKTAKAQTRSTYLAAG
jgi:hypothetical protein